MSAESDYHCPKCGYDWVAIPLSTCPQCTAAAKPTTPNDAAREAAAPPIPCANVVVTGTDRRLAYWLTGDNEDDKLTRAAQYIRAYLDSEVAKATKPLVNVIKGLLKSADCSWYETNAGHDWRNAVEFAEATLLLAHHRTHPEDGK